MSKLATFRIDESKWEAFQEVAKAQGISATAMLVQFVEWVNAGNQLEKPEAVIATNDVDLDSRIDSKLAPILDSRIDSKLEPILEKLSRLEAIEERLGELAA